MYLCTNYCFELRICSRLRFTFLTHVSNRKKNIVMISSYTTTVHKHYDERSWARFSIRSPMNIFLKKQTIFSVPSERFFFVWFVWPTHTRESIATSTIYAYVLRKILNNNVYTSTYIGKNIYFYIKPNASRRGLWCMPQSCFKGNFADTVKPRVCLEKFSPYHVCVFMLARVLFILKKKKNPVDFVPTPSIYFTPNKMRCVCVFVYRY